MEREEASAVASKRREAEQADKAAQAERSAEIAARLHDARPLPRA